MMITISLSITINAKYIFFRAWSGEVPLFEFEPSGETYKSDSTDWKIALLKFRLMFSIGKIL